MKAGLWSARVGLGSMRIRYMSSDDESRGSWVNVGRSWVNTGRVLGQCGSSLDQRAQEISY